MKKKDFTVEAARGTSYFDGIEIMLSQNCEEIHHRHFFYSGTVKKTGKISTSIIRYAKPEWSKDEEPYPYFMRLGMREYLAEYARCES
jgi:hypothetical protein